MEQYRYVGQDPMGRLIYEPNLQNYENINPCLCKCSKKKNHKGSIFSKWFVVEEGVISLSLKDFTVLFSLIVTLTLLMMLWQSCQAGNFECTIEKWPMISDVINQEMYIRVFILLMTMFMFGV